MSESITKYNIEELNLFLDTCYQYIVTTSDSKTELYAYMKKLNPIFKNISLYIISIIDKYYSKGTLLQYIDLLKFNDTTRYSEYIRYLKGKTIYHKECIYWNFKYIQFDYIALDQKENEDWLLLTQENHTLICANACEINAAIVALKNAIRSRMINVFIMKSILLYYRLPYKILRELDRKIENHFFRDIKLMS